MFEDKTREHSMSAIIQTVRGSISCSTSCWLDVFVCVQHVSHHPVSSSITCSTSSWLDVFVWVCESRGGSCKCIHHIIKTHSIAAFVQSIELM